MARTAGDVALMLQAIAGASPTAPLRQPMVGRDFVGAVREGPNEVSVVAKWPGIGLALFTNGHNMSGTTQGSQRYMRAMAHLPLLMLGKHST